MFRLLKRLIVTLLMLCALLGISYVFRAPLLRGAASVWIVSDPLSRADAIVVLGGGPSTRPFEAARLFHQGLAPKILLTNSQPAPATQPSLLPADADLERSILLSENVPASCIFMAPEPVDSTYLEALSVRTWAKTNNIKRLIVATDVFHTRRVRWLFRKELGPAGIQVEVDAVPVREYTTTNWWQHDDGIVAFENEILKYAYYRLKY